MSSKIERAISLGISADTTEAQRDLRRMYATIRQTTEPFEELKRTSKLLSLELNDGAVKQQHFSDAAAKAALKADKQAAAIAKVRAEFAKLGGADWAAGLKNLGTSQFAQEFRSARAGADAFAAGLRNINDRAREQAQVAREAQAALSGWANGLRQVGTSQFARQVQQARVGADAFAAGLRNMAQAAEQARQHTERLAREGRQYMQQFETLQQRVNRQIAEARHQFHSGRIDAAQYAQAIRGISRQNSMLIASFNQFRGAMLSMIGPLVILYKAWEGFTASIRLSAELEAAEARFKIFTGSIGEAKEQLQEIRDLSSESPVSFAGAQRAVVTMHQFGVESATVIQHLKEIAEITGGDTQRMEMLSLAFAQSQAAGRLMGQELLQMVNAGFNPLKIISEQTGESLVDLKKKMEEGGISSEMVARAFKDATSEGGRFHGLLEEIAGTTAGKLTRAGSEVEKLATAFGDLIKPATDGTLNEFILQVQSLTEWMNLMAGNKPETSLFKEMTKELEKLEEMRATWQSPLDFTGPTNEELDKEIAFLKDKLNALKQIEEIQQRASEGKELTNVEQIVLEQANQEQRTKSSVSLEEFTRLREVLLLELERTKDQRERLKLMTQFYDRVGEGRFNDEDLEIIKAQREEFEKLNQEAINAKRVTDAFADAIAEVEADIVSERYGDKADLVNALLAQSVDGERDKLQALIDQGAAYGVIWNAANRAAQAEARRLANLNAELSALEKQAEADKEAAKEQEKLDKEAEKHAERVADLIKGSEDALANQRDLLNVTKEEARIRQLMREEEMGRWDAAEIAANERKAEALKERLSLKEEAEKLKKDSNPFASFIDELAKLRAMKDSGFIDRDLYNTERDKLIRDNTKVDSLGAAPAFQKGSQEAFKAYTGQAVDHSRKQLEASNRIALLTKTGQALDQKRNEILDSIAENKPSTVGP